MKSSSLGAIIVADWESGRGGHGDASNTVSAQRLVFSLVMDSSSGWSLIYLSLSKCGVWCKSFCE
jgi:hypothetical protein